MIVQVVKYKTGLSDEEAAKTIAQRAPQYEALSGLRQKLYIREPETGEYGGIYVWEDEDSMREFRESDLAGDDPRGLPSRGRAASRGVRGRLCPSPRARYRIDELSRWVAEAIPAARRHSRASRVS